LGGQRAGKPPGDSSESPAITRAAWRFGALTQRCYLAPLLAGLGGSPPTGARCCRRGETISRGHNGRSGWFWQFQLHPMRPGDNCRRLGHVGWAQGTPETPFPLSPGWTSGFFLSRNFLKHYVASHQRRGPLSLVSTNQGPILVQDTYLWRSSRGTDYPPASQWAVV
jgi:hypothetical protein